MPINPISQAALRNLGQACGQTVGRFALSWDRCFLSLVLILATIMLSTIVHARSLNAAGEREIARCIRLAADGKPWLEKTLWGLRDQEGGWTGARVLNSNGSHDLGPLQVNSWWAGKLASATGRSADQIRWWLTHDACFNVAAARWIFLSGLMATGSYWKAVGVYHSPTLWRQQRYSEAVSQHLQRRYGKTVFAGSAAIRPDRP